MKFKLTISKTIYPKENKCIWIEKDHLLDSLEKDYNADNWHTISRQLNEKDMMELTTKFEEHPEGFEDACLCQLCCSYG